MIHALRSCLFFFISNVRDFHAEGCRFFLRLLLKRIGPSLFRYLTDSRERRYAFVPFAKNIGASVNATDPNRIWTRLSVFIYWNVIHYTAHIYQCILFLKICIFSHQFKTNVKFNSMFITNTRLHFIVFVEWRKSEIQKQTNTWDGNVVFLVRKWVYLLKYITLSVSQYSGKIRNYQILW